jgi:hypothetical protein
VIDYLHALADKSKNKSDECYREGKAGLAGMYMAEMAALNSAAQGIREGAHLRGSSV